MDKKLYRNISDKMIGGVASGLSDYLDIDVTIIRIIFVLMAFFGLSGFLIYVILWIVVPEKPFIYTYTDSRKHEEPEPAVDPLPYAEPVKPKRRSGRARVTIGLILVIFGVYFLAREFGLIPYWFGLHKLWPLIFIIPGILILSASKKKEEKEDFRRSEPETSADPFKEDGNRDINSDQPLS